MIKSMTGYGSASGELEGKKILIEIKSVNHRYSDITVKSPRTYTYLEDAVRRTVSDSVSRGKIDVGITVNTLNDTDKVVVVNHTLASGYLSALEEISKEYGIECGATAVAIARFPDVFALDKADDDSQKVTDFTVSLTKEAIRCFDDMRGVEGKKLCEDMLSHLSVIENHVKTVQERVPLITKEYRERLEAKIKEVLENTEYDESRVLTEVAIFADKVDTNEEIVRLQSHISQMRQMLTDGEQIGRKLDFVIQEMNREINTIGSKSNDLSIAKIVIEVKAEIEKLREQAQNVE